MSSAVALQPDLRALTMFDVVPAHHIAVFVRDRHNVPHLNPGELAIVDTRDREPVHGELFAIRWNRPPLGIVQTNPQPDKRRDWWCMSLNRPRSKEELDRWIAERRELVASDGPYEADGLHLKSKLVGRVVGVMVPG